MKIKYTCNKTSKYKLLHVQKTYIINGVSSFKKRKYVYFYLDSLKKERKYDTIYK